MICIFLSAMMHKYANTKNKQPLKNALIVSLCAFVEWFSITQIVYPAVCLAVWYSKDFLWSLVWSSLTWMTFCAVFFSDISDLPLWDKTGPRCIHFLPGKSNITLYWSDKCSWLEYNLLFVARSGGDTNDKEAPDRTSKEGQGGGDSKAKKVWREHENRWSHDRYNADEQAPKSCEELIAVYGYDIRNEEGPPRARRRRRYG